MPKCYRVWFRDPADGTDHYVIVDAVSADEARRMAAHPRWADREGAQVDCLVEDE